MNGAPNGPGPPSRWSENLRRWRRVPITWLFLWLIGAELVLRAYSQPLYSTLCGPLAEPELTGRSLDMYDAPVSIALLGDSRMQSALAPRVMERELNLPPGGVVSLAITSGVPSDALAIYREHRDRLAGAQLIIFGVNEWHFNTAAVAGDDNARDARFRARSNLGDRLEFPKLSHVPDLFLGYFWTWWDMRPTLALAANCMVARGDPRARPVQLDDLGRPAQPETLAAFFFGLEDSRLVELGLERPVEETSGQLLATYQLWSYEVDALRDLARQVTADGPRFLLIRLPLAASYNAAVAARYPRQEESWLTAVREGVPETPLIDLRDPAPWNLVEQREFWDYGHYTRHGSVSFSEQFARWLRASGSLPQPSSA
jgi:hypothetical protein